MGSNSKEIKKTRARILTPLQAVALETLEDVEWLATHLLIGNIYSIRKNMRRYYISGAPRRAELNTKRSGATDTAGNAALVKLLCRLRAQNLISSQNASRRSGNVWHITKNGAQALRMFRKNQVLNDAMVENAGQKDRLKIVSFDIPEDKKHARAWIRMALRRLEYRILQKSVWIGEAKLPKEFFIYLNERKIIDCVHVFEVTKRGSIPVKKV